MHAGKEWHLGGQADTIAGLHQAARDLPAGNDIDAGAATSASEHEATLAAPIRERIEQVQHALARIDQGDYGMCELCGNPIPAGRLARFPAVTLCVPCKASQERGHVK